MYSRCKWPLLLGAVAISVALATVKKPYGPKMCERLCNRIAGCSYYIYRTSYLSCHLTPAMLQKQGKGIYQIKATKDNERINAENAVNCSQDKQIFRTRRHVIKCRPVLPNLPTLTNKEDVADGRMTRLLMMPQSPKRPRSMRQLFLANNSIVTYPFLRSNVAHAIAYIPSQRKLVMSTGKPTLIIFVSVDAKNKTVQKTKYIIVQIGIDDKKQLMFMYIVIKESVCFMRTHDKELTLLFKPSCRFGDFSVDSNRSLIYVLCQHSKILQYTYKGVPKGPVVEIENVGLLLYIQGDMLYHQLEDEMLVQISLSDHTVTKLIQLDRYMQGLLKVGNILYLAPRPHLGDILVVNVSDIGSVTELKTGFGTRAHNMAMCLIP